MTAGALWEDGVPVVMFAVREVMLGFSPAELVFGIKDYWSNNLGPKNILDYVYEFHLNYIVHVSWPKRICRWINVLIVVPNFIVLLLGIRC